MAASSALDLSTLRAQLEQRFGRVIVPSTGRPEEHAGGLGFGVDPLDRLLPGGVPRGALSLWTGGRTSGRTALLRALVTRAAAEGQRSAIVDAAGALLASGWCRPEGPLPGLWVVRPPDAASAHEAAWVAEALLRSGAFDLVALHGGAVDAAEAHRLRALAREREVALVVSQEAAYGIRADVALELAHEPRRLARGRYRGRVQVRLLRSHTGRPGGEREVESGVDAPDRLRPHRELRDRALARR